MGIYLALILTLLGSPRLAVAAEPELASSSDFVEVSRSHQNIKSLVANLAPVLSKVNQQLLNEKIAGLSDTSFSVQKLGQDHFQVSTGKTRVLVRLFGEQMADFYAVEVNRKIVKASIFASPSAVWEKITSALASTGTNAIDQTAAAAVVHLAWSQMVGGFCERVSRAEKMCAEGRIEARTAAFRLFLEEAKDHNTCAQAVVSCRTLQKAEHQKGRVRRIPAATESNK